VARLNSRADGSVLGSVAGCTYVPIVDNSPTGSAPRTRARACGRAKRGCSPEGLTHITSQRFEELDGLEVAFDVLLDQAVEEAAEVAGGFLSPVARGEFGDWLELHFVGDFGAFWY